MPYLINNGHRVLGLPLLALVPSLLFVLHPRLSVAATTPATKVALKASFKNNVLNYVGSVSGTNAVAGMPVSIYDAGSGVLLHAMRTDYKKRVNYALPLDIAPCALRVEVGNISSFVKVSGAPKSCATSLSCAISASKVSVKTGEAITFTAQTQFVGKQLLPAIAWDFGNGDKKTSTATAAGVASDTASYKHAGRYAVSYTATVNGNQCQDSVVVAVAPNVPNLPPPVAEVAAKPAAASAMTGAYAVFPFNEKSEVGISLTSYNQYIQTQALNAIVYKKDPKKPIVQSLGDVNVFYSAAFNPLDPVGSDSINSTSQNWFADGTAGANYDASDANALNKDATKRITKILPNKSYDGAQADGIKKTGLYDRVANRDNNGGSSLTGLTSAPSPQLTNLDEGGGATLDNLTGKRAMPGKSGAYSRNDEQEIKVAATDGSFSAQMLPITGVDDKGRKNPFPLMRVVAKQGTQTLAAADAVVTSSSEVSCAACHSKGGISGNDEVWRTPVTVGDPEAKGDGSAHPNGSGSTYPGTHDSIWAPAIQNRFELKIVSTDAAGKNTYQMVNPLDANGVYLRKGVGFDQDAVYKPLFVKNTNGTDFISNITNKPMILRGDRIRAYRIQDGKLQVQLNFYAPENDTQAAKEKAALLNMSILHDYYDSFGPSNPAGGPTAPKPFVSQFADNLEDKATTTTINPPSCGGHHVSNITHDVGRGSTYDSRIVYSQYSRTMHAFHGRLQVYKEAVPANAAPDGIAHAKGELIRDKRGHHIPFGGAGWDPEQKDDFKLDIAGQYDGKRNNFDPALVPMHPKGELLLQFDLKRDANGAMLPSTATTKLTDMTENCAICHAGKTEQVYHDIHLSAGLKCESCHGDMQATGGLWPFSGKKIGDKHAFRVAEYDEPNCGSCHFGDNPTAARLAYDKTDKAATSKAIAKDSIDQRFAVLPSTLLVKRVGLARAFDKVCFGTTECNDIPVNNSINGELAEVTASPLFRKSADSHGNVPCSLCHGSAHTTWPITDPNANDNVTPKQLQGYDGTLMECDTCHSKDGNNNSFADGMLANDLPVAYGKRGTLVLASNAKGYLAGPHGLHPINDANWYSDAPLDANNTPGGWHSVSATIPGPNGEDQCAACHGKNHQSGNRLAKTQVKRVYKDMVIEKKKKTVTLEAGQIVNCTDCHSQKISFRNTPWEKEYKSFK